MRGGGSVQVRSAEGQGKERIMYREGQKSVQVGGAEGGSPRNQSRGPPQGSMQHSNPIRPGKYFRPLPCPPGADL